MTIFICGFMGCGKSALGKVLSQKLGLQNIDTDEYIVEKYQMSIPEIFEKFGENTFRKYETEAVKEITGKNAIVSCGGGLMQSDENSRLAKLNGGIIVFLDQTFEICYERIKGDKNRPLVVNNTKEQLHEIYNKRSEIYKRNSTIELIPGDTPEQSAEKLIKLLDSKGLLK